MRIPSLDVFAQDIRHGFRVLARNPGFTAVAVLSLALGIGACTAIFSVVDSVLLRSLPYPDAERLVQLREVDAANTRMAVTEPGFLDVRAQNRCFEAVTEYSQSLTTVVGGSEPVRIHVTAATREFFRVLGVSPRLGNTFLSDSGAGGRNPIVVVSYGFWRRQLGGREDLAEVTLKIDDLACTVVGVMPAGFSYPQDTDIWMPRELLPPQTSRSGHNWEVLARLNPAVSLGQARAEISALGRQLKREYGADMDAVDFALVPLREYLVGDVRRALAVLSAAVAFLLLVAYTNVANLLLAQVTARQKEFAVRAALGASRRRLALQLVSENVLLALAAGALGAALSALGVNLLIALNQKALPRANEIAVDIRVLLFTLLLSLLVAMALGLMPVLRLSDKELHTDLKDAGRGLSASVASKRLRSLFTVAQIGFTLILLVGAGLLGDSFIRLLQVDPGFKVEKTVAMDLSLPASVADDEREIKQLEKFFDDFLHGRNPAPPLINHARQERVGVFYQQLLDRLEQLPGVTAVGAVNLLPLSGAGAEGTFWIDNDLAKSGSAEYRSATQGYFAAMGVPLLRGRLFEATDGPAAPPAGVVSQALARKVWPGEDPIGKRIQIGNMDGDVRLLTIVGVVGDVHNRGVDAEVSPVLYANAMQRPQPRGISVVVRAHGDAGPPIAALRRIVQEINPELPANFRTLKQIYSSSLDQQRFSLAIFAVFAAAALTLAAIGIYGVMSYSVTQRTHEIGLRMALGAQAGDVRRMILGEGMKLTLIGIALGCGAGLALSGLMASLLFGVRPGNPATFAVSAALVSAAALLACYIPVRRATRVDPVMALRNE